MASESFTAADFRALVTSFVGPEGVYIVRGFEVVSKNGLTVGINVADSQVFNTTDSNGSFYIGLPDDPDISIELPADQTNIFVEARFSNTTDAAVNRGFWDPLSLSGETDAGQQFTASADSQNVLQVEISVNTTGFSEGAVPLFRAATSSSSVTSFQDSRNLLFRLATGGANPDPLSKYGWSSSRSEPVTSGTGVGDNVDSPWRARDASGAINDKAFRSLKDWADAVMTRISEISGNSIWYQSTAGGGSGATNVSLQQLFFDSVGHSLQASKNASFKWVTQNGGLRLVGEGTINLNGTTGQYHNGLIRWQSNNTSLRWELGGTFASNTPGGKRNYTSSGLRFESPIPVDDGNVYLLLEREVSKGSGANVDWGNAGASPFSAQEAVTGSSGDFTGIALGDYIRKESGGYNDYFKVIGFFDGTNTFDNSVANDQNLIADSTIVTLNLQAVTDPSNTNISASNEALRYFRSRYSDADLVADTSVTAEGVVHGFQNSDFYWLGRRNGSLFFLRDYGTLQEGEEATILDSVYAHGQSGGASSPLVLEHAKEAHFESGSGGYKLKTGSGELIKIYKRKRDNTVEDPSSGDNSNALQEYTIAAPVGELALGEALWVRLDDDSDGALSNGTVTDSTDAEDNTSINSNRWEIRSATDAPLSNYDNIDVFLLARRIDVDGRPSLLFHDGTVLNLFGESLDSNTYVAGRMALGAYTNTLIPFIKDDGTKELDEDSELYFDQTNRIFGVLGIQISTSQATLDNPDDFGLFPNMGAHQLALGGALSTVFIPGDLIVGGSTFSTYTENVQSEDKLISLGVGELLDQAFGGGIELADDTKTPTQADVTSGNQYIDLTFGSAHGYTTGDIIGVAATDDVGGITAGEIGGQYTVVATATTDGDAEVISSTVLRIYTGGTATSTVSDTTNTPKTYQSPWSIRLGGADGSYTGITSWVFNVKGVDPVTMTPVTNYGISPTAHSTRMLAGRIPFVNDDNAGPSGVDTTLNFSPSLTWDDATSTFSVVGSISAGGNIIPDTDATYTLGESTTPLRWKELHLSSGSGSGIFIGDSVIYENATDELKTDDVFETLQYFKARLHVEIGETTALTGPTHLPDTNSLNIFVRDGLVYSQDSGGNQELLTNSDGNVYSEIVDVVNSPTGNNQTGPIASPPQVVTLPQDTISLVGAPLLAATDGSTATVTVTAPSHGLSTGDLITTISSVDIGGILAADLSVTDSPVTVIDADTFEYTANATSSSVDSDFLDIVTAIKIRNYVVGQKEIKVYLNQVWQTRGVDFDEVGSFNSTSNQISWLRTLQAGDVIEYRIDSNGGQTIINQGGGGGGSLQNAYDNGASIVTSGSVPVSITAPSGDAMSITGPITMSGIMKNITAAAFAQQGSNPLSGAQYGVYVNTSGQLIYSNAGTPLNISNDLYRRNGSLALTGNMDAGANRLTNLAAPTADQDAATKKYVDDFVFVELTNNTGVTVTAGTVVVASESVAGELELADASTLTESDSVVGVVESNIADTATGKVRLINRIAVNQSAPFSPGKPVYLSETAGEGTSTKPTTNGSFVVILGYAINTTDVLLDPQIVKINGHYEERLTVVSGTPADDNEVQSSGGTISAGTTLTIPLNSRNSNAADKYIVGSGQLEIFLNNVKIDPDIITEIGTTGTSSTDFSLNYELRDNDVLVIKIRSKE